jgi:hypothetical protein
MVPTVAFRVTDCAVITGETVALKAAVVAPVATVTEAGTVTAVLSLDRLTTSPPVGAAAFTVTWQASVAAPAMELLVQVTSVGTGVPVPLSAIVSVGFVDVWVVTVNVPVTAPAAVGANLTVNL